jgi:phosphopantothenoylcysteine decarboxylase / phosphopantothenate---cysteine ligase
VVGLAADVNLFPVPQNIRIVLGITGSIAAYKSPEILRRLREAGASVRVAMTPAAAKFVGPMTFEALGSGPVYLDPASLDPALNRGSGIGHTDMTSESDALLVAPATADIIAKLAHGLGDDPVSVLALALRRDGKLILAPAMNPRMWANPAVQENLELLISRGAVVIGPGSGDTACGDQGTGRMAEPDEIVAATIRAIAVQKRGGVGPRVVILSGPTREAIDDVRFVSNGSSGRMGSALAEAAWEAGADVTVVSGPAAFTPPSWIRVIRIGSATQMLEAATALEYDLLFSPAAVADYRPRERKAGKPPKSDAMTLELIRTPDVLASLAAHHERTGRHPHVVAFAAEDSLQDAARAREKSRGKGARWVVVNAATETMGRETARVQLIEVESGKTIEIGPDLKRAVAEKIFRSVV